jgi:hypothetical protein
MVLEIDQHFHPARYATYAALAGVDPEDHQAADFKLPPLDSKVPWCPGRSCGVSQKTL